ncbi:MAG: tetratricopeptide repeat protein [Candidatus Lokiarchaeota archaeon]|nr:tetratricopeptide repeat protein [Candidatus Lokiarchaeota archaeon]
MSDKKEYLVFDANFFICMLQIRARNILGNLEKAAKELGYEYYISDVVFDEIKAPHTYKDKLKEILNVVKVLPIEIDDIKNDLIRYNIRFPAQDPDLSLVYIAKNLIDDKGSAPIHLVTDDFKLVKNTSLLYKGKLNILSLSSFLLKTQRTTSNSQMRKYFKDIWKRSLNYTLSYMIERSKTYPAEQKITWLIEKAITVTEDSILTQDVELENPDVGMRFEIGASRYLEEINIADKYINNQNLPKSEEEKVLGIIKFLENLKISREYMNRARDAIVKSESKEAVKHLKKGNKFLISLLQVASGQLEKTKDYKVIEQLICSEISKMEFLRAYLLVSLGRINSAISSLDRAALFSTIIHNHKTCLTLNYVKALIYLFHGLYKNAIMQYNFTEELAEIYEDDRLKLKSLIGKAIALYMQGEDKDTAMIIMEEISTMNLDENHLDAIIVFSELGDYFLALGHSQIAANLYNQALEISIDYKLTLKSEILIEKLKRSYIATVLSGYSAEDMVDKLDVLLDKAYSIKDVEKYNEQIKKISSFNLLFYTPFPYITGKKRIIPFSKLPKELKEDHLEVVHFKKDSTDKEKILFIVSHYELGLLGVRLKTSQKVTGIAENYTLKIKPTAKVKIYEPDEDLKNDYLIRAIVEITQKNQVKINFTLPSFFKQLNL